VVGGGTDKSNLKRRLATAVPGLADADEAMFERLLEKARVVMLSHDRFVFHAGDLCQAFLVLLDGEVRVQLTAANGREVA
jgi:CRP/FNR family transcriptional regulator